MVAVGKPHASKMQALTSGSGSGVGAAGASTSAALSSSTAAAAAFSAASSASGMSAALCQQRIDELLSVAEFCTLVGVAGLSSRL